MFNSVKDIRLPKLSGRADIGQEERYNFVRCFRLPNDSGNLPTFESVRISSDRDFSIPKDSGSLFIDLQAYRLIFVKFFNYLIEPGRLLILDCLKSIAERLVNSPKF